MAETPEGGGSPGLADGNKSMPLHQGASHPIHAAAAASGIPSDAPRDVSRASWRGMTGQQPRGLGRVDRTAEVSRRGPGSKRWTTRAHARSEGLAQHPPWPATAGQHGDWAARGPDPALGGGPGLEYGVSGLGLRGGGGGGARRDARGGLDATVGMQPHALLSPG